MNRVLLGALSLWLISWIAFGPAPALALSIEQEANLGKEFLARMKSRFQFLEDDFANTFINEFGTHLSAALDTRPFPLKFYIIKEDELNAFAGPGGHIFFFSGLIEAFDNLDQLGAVICHEMGHVAARHLSERIQKAKKIGIATLAGILAGILIGGEGAEALITGSVAAGIQAQLHYSREDERQADQLSFKYMKRACLNPEAMIQVLKKFHTKQWTTPKKAPPYLLTHPTGPERMANLDSMLRGHEKCAQTPSKIRKFREEFPFFKAIVRALCLPPRIAEAKFKQDLEDDPGAAYSHLGLGVLYCERGMFAQAIDHLLKADSSKPSYPLIIKRLGETHLLAGNYDKARVVLERALGIAPQDQDVQFLLAKAYQNLGNYQESISILERLKAQGAKEEEVLYQLGIAYGRLGRLAMAHYNFGLFFKKQGRKAKARFHFKKALQHASSDPGLRDKIYKESKGLLK